MPRKYLPHYCNGMQYGNGFLPEEDLKDQTRSFLMSVNQSITETRKHVSIAVTERRKKNAKSTRGSHSKTTPVVLEVSATEVIPIISTTKAHNLATGKKTTPLRRTSDTVEALQFYLVDCRPESIATEQGRFPTAVTLSPEKLQDPDELQKLTDMFESLRGAVHICVMVSLKGTSLQFLRNRYFSCSSFSYSVALNTGRRICLLPCTIQPYTLGSRTEAATG